MPPQFLGESARADEAQRQTNADVLRTVFDLVLALSQQGVLALSQQGVQERTVIDCADSKTPLCFPILSAWIGDHAALHGIGSKSCPKCEVLCNELGGNPLKMYETRDYILYGEKTLRHEPAEVAGIAEYFKQVGVKIGNNVFARLDQVNPADLHKPHLLHNNYLGLFKHMMEGVEGFLKKHKRRQAFNNVGKEIPPYPGLSLPKKAYHEVTQGQGKKIGNDGRCISAVLVSAFGNPDRSHYHDFKRALKCVSTLVDFALRAQYRSHTPDTLVYLERYQQTFPGPRRLFLSYVPQRLCVQKQIVRIGI